jgi:hypothetical protein
MSTIEGKYCRAQVEKHLYQLRSVSGLWQGTNCPAYDVIAAREMVFKYDRRADLRIRIAEQRNGRAFTEDELISEGKNPLYNPNEWLQQSPNWERYCNLNHDVSDRNGFDEGLPRSHRGKTFTLITNRGVHHTGATVCTTAQYRAEGIYWLSQDGLAISKENVVAWKEE